MLTLVLQSPIRTLYFRTPFPFLHDRPTRTSAHAFSSSSSSFSSFGKTIHCISSAYTAYEVLSDGEKRQIYDQYGEEGLRQHEGQQGQQGGFGGFDIFNQFFGGGGFGFGRQPQEEQTPKGHDVRIQFPVTLEDLYVGVKRTILRDKIELSEAKGKKTRDCRCKQKLVQKMVGPNMIQQYTQEVQKSELPLPVYDHNIFCVPS